MLKIFFVIVLLTLPFLGKQVTAQPIYNFCNQALELCPNQIFSVSNIDANAAFCPDCEDDFTFCFSPENSIWFTFTTNTSGGNVSVDFSSLLFETNPGQGTEIQASILSASVPCNSSSYSQIGNCISNGIGPFSLTSAALLPSTVYYIVVSGSNSGLGVTSPAECSFDLSISGTAVDRPVSSVDLAVSSTSICQNEIFTASAITLDCPDIVTYKWFVNSILVAETTDPLFQTTSLMNGDVVSVETDCYILCPVTVTDLSSPITVTSFPLDAGIDLFVDFGDTVQLHGTTSAVDFVWSPSFGVSDTNSLDPFVWPITTTVYTLSATENGCTFSDQVTVFVDPKLIIPNTFSPNDDGLNDTWTISGIELYPDCFVLIYDRWGQEVFQSTGYSVEKAWDGTLRSGEMSEGVYFFVLQLRDSDKQEFKGSITLIR